MVMALSRIGIGFVTSASSRIAMSVLSELSVSSQVHLPDNKKARWGQRAFSLGS
jgi:hypothetical protein